jgi:GT2 family glycosyltransferase
VTVRSEGAVLADVGLVAIGRNEGERLHRCLESVVGRVAHVVYVDSGSTDGSAELARSLGCEVVALDMSIPFTAARARNEGVARLREVAGVQRARAAGDASDASRGPPRDTGEASTTALRYVQLVDGDCEVVEGWLETAHARLDERPELAVVCGRRRERHPEASVYNRLCDIEWDTPVGEAKACGGDAMMRVEAFVAVGGFDETLIAGEEPELCVRLRQAGWKIERLDAEMTLHDAAMTHFAQWWRRMRRSGHAYAEGAALHGAPPEEHWVRETKRALFWGAGVPAVALGAALPTLGLSLGLLGAYGVSAARVYRSVRERGRPAEDALPYAVFTTLGKLPEVQGVLEYHANRLRGRRRGLIEYK